MSKQHLTDDFGKEDVKVDTEKLKKAKAIKTKALAENQTIKK